MDNAYVLFINILVMLFFALPGFVLIKTKMIKPTSISGLNILLLYVCQPCLSYHALTKIGYSKRIMLNMLYTFLIALVLMLSVILLFRFITRKKQKESIATRIANVATGFGNCTFMGIPLLEALLPSYPEAVVYSIFFFISMAIIGWTVACYIITNDKKYVSLKKIIINPAIIGLAFALPFFITGAKLPTAFHDAVNLLGKMSTPICMLILGMRLATLPLKTVFLDKSKYLTIFLRQVIVPIIYLLVFLVLPIEHNLKVTILVCASAPVAAVVLNYAELLGEGQEYAAGVIILSTLFSVLTMPLIVLLII